MILKEISEEEYRNYAYKQECFSFSQTIEIGNLKEIYGYKKIILGLFNKTKLVGATMILKRKVLLNYYEFYAPRGFITDYNNEVYVSEFTKLLAKYVKENGGFKFIIDPPIIYRIRNNDGSINPNYHDNNDIIYLLKKLGYVHRGFNLNFENRQVRFVYRKKLLNTYDETLKSFTKSTIKNIENTIENGVRVRVGNENDLDELSFVFDHTAKLKGFSSRSLSYYKNMYKLFNKYMTIYIAYLDVNLFLQNMEKKLKLEIINKHDIESKMKIEKVGKKLTNDLNICDGKIKKNEDKIKYAHKLLNNKQEKITIGALLSIKSGKENITFMSGTNEEFVEFGPKYAFYNQHIIDSLDEKFEYVNFYGISGNFEKNNKYYGIYELKKGFNGEVVEYIGEFTFVTNQLIYKNIKFLSSLKRVCKIGLTKIKRSK